MIQQELKEVWSYKEIRNLLNSRWNFEILALLQDDSIYLVSLVRNSE